LALSRSKGTGQNTEHLSEQLHQILLEPPNKTAYDGAPHLTC